MQLFVQNPCVHVSGMMGHAAVDDVFVCFCVTDSI
jgi:hypothetical protein